MATCALLLLFIIGAAAKFTDEQRKSMKEYVETEHLYTQRKADEGYAHGRRLGLDDDFNIALANLGPHLERSVKTALLRQLGATEADGMPEREPGSMFLPELRKDMKVIGENIAQLMRQKKTDEARRLQALQVRQSSPDHARKAKLLLSAKRSERSAARQEEDLSEDFSWRRSNLSGPVGSVGSVGSVSSERSERRLQDSEFGRCEVSNKPYALWWVVAGASTDFQDPVEPAYANKKCSGEVEHNNEFRGGITNEYSAKWCKVESADAVGSAYGLVGSECPEDSFPGFTTGSKCEVQNEGLPGSINCHLALALAPRAHIYFDLEFKFGYGGSGGEDDLVAEVSYGMYTSQFPKPCLGTSDYICEALALCWNAMSKFLDIGAAVGGKLMSESIELYPLRFSFPAKYDGGRNGIKPMQLFRMPITKKAVAKSFGATTKDISLEDGNFCLSNVWQYVTLAGHAKPALKLLGLSMDLLGSDVCFEFPGVTVDDTGALTTGFKIGGYAFDKDKVDPESIWNLFPDFMKPLVDGYSGEGVEPTAGLKAEFDKDQGTLGHYYNLHESLKSSITDSFPGDKITINLDIAFLLGEANSNTVVRKGDNSYVLKFRNFASTTRRLNPSPHDLKPPDMVTLDLPPSFFAEQRRLYEENRARRLQQAPQTYPVASQNDAPLIKNGTRCYVTLEGMPKTLQCDLVVGEAGNSGFELKLRAKAQLMYDLSGTGMIVTSGLGLMASLDFGRELSSTVKGALQSLEGVVDLGAMIDEMFTGSIKFLPTMSFSFPNNFNDAAHNVFEVARAEVPTLKAEGICVQTLDKLGVHPSVGDMVKILEHFMDPFGADACINSPKLAVDQGFKLDVNAQSSIFKPSAIDIMPLVEMISDIAGLGYIAKIILAILPESMRKALNDAVKTVMPKQMDLNFNIGKALHDAAAPSGGRRMATSKHGRRLDIKTLVDSEGVFDLGGYFASAAPGSKDVGVSSAGDDDTSSAGDKDTSSAGDKDTSSTGAGEKDTSSAGDKDPFSRAGDKDPSSAGDGSTSSAGDNVTNSSVELVSSASSSMCSMVSFVLAVMALHVFDYL